MHIFLALVLAVLISGCTPSNNQTPSPSPTSSLSSEATPTPSASSSASVKPKTSTSPTSQKTSPTKTATPKPQNSESSNSTGGSNSNQNSGSSSTPTQVPTARPSATPTPRPTVTPTPPTPTAAPAAAIEVNRSQVTVTLDRASAQPNSETTGEGFTMKANRQLGFELVRVTGDNGAGFDLSTGGMGGGQTINVKTRIVHTLPNGTYTGSYVLRYSYNGQTYSWGTINYSITLTGNTIITQDGTLTVDKTNVVETLSRSNAQHGLIYGSGFNITSQGATAYSVRGSPAGIGFYNTSGGISPGSTSSISTYASTNLSNGTYTGTVTVEYQKNGSYATGPNVTYSITITD